MADKKLETVKLGGGADYAKVATRLKEFRSEFGKSKIETVHVQLESGETESRSYIWKDKGELLELMKAGITDPEILRSSADANGSARKKLSDKDKDFEKLESISVGRGLAMLGYLSSGEIASFEEMQEFAEYKNERKFEAIQADIDTFTNAKTIDELAKAWKASDFKQEPSVVEAKDKRKAELEKPAEKKDVSA